MKRTKRLSSIVTSFLLVVSMILPSFSVMTYAASSPTLSIDSKTVNQGEEFTVTVKVQNAANSVYNGNFTLQYDNSKLEAVSYTYGGIFNDHTKNCNLDYQSKGNQIRFTFSGAYALKQDGTLVAFSFRAKSTASGASNLQFTAYKLYDENGNSLGSNAAGSTVTISAKPTVKPQLSLTGGTVEAGKTITVPINISNSSGVYNGNFTLQYDSNLLTTESFTYGSIFNDHTKNCNLNYQSIGNQIRFTFSGAYALKQDGTLINITFKVKENVSGTAALQFTAYKMYDENGVSIDTVVSNGSVTVTPKRVKTLSSVSVQTKPAKTTYYIGDSLETRGLQLKLTYSDDSTETITNGFTTSGFSSTSAGTKTATVAYGGKTATFTVTVNTPTISLSSYNRTMKVGDTITLTATTAPLEQSVTWTSSNTNVVTITKGNDWGPIFRGSQISSDTNVATGLNGTITAKAAGTAIITAKFTYNGYTYSKTCSVTVVEDPVVLSDMRIYTEPSKTTYYIDDALNTEGLKLLLSYSDGSTEYVISGFEISGFHSNTIGTKTVTVNYNGFIDTFSVIVKMPTLNLSSENVIMDIDDTTTIIATTTPSGYRVDWESSDTSIVTVSNGILTAKAAGTTTVKAWFFYNGSSNLISKTCSVTVSATPDPIVLSSISINNMPTKIVYEIGESLNTSGLVLKLAYSDGSISTVNSGFITSGFSSTTTGTKTVTVTYENRSTTFNVTVKPRTENADFAFKLGSVSGMPGETVSLNVEFNAKGTFTYLIFENLSYDTSKLEFIGYSLENSELFKSSYQSLSQDEALTANGVEMMFDNNGDPVMLSGVFCTLKFKILDNAEDGEVAISASCRTNRVREELSTQIIPGVVQVSTWLQGDFNNDGVIDMKDMRYFGRWINLPDRYPIPYNKNTDFNGDGVLDMKDMRYFGRWVNLPERYPIQW